jgi:hypothetical protein
MTGNMQKLRALGWSERLVLLQAMLLLPLFWAALRVIGLSRLHSWVTRTPLAAGAPRLDVDPAAIGALINSAGNHVPFPSTCLTRSLLLNWLLRRRGMRSEFRIGVRMTDGRLDAHAWVEYEGRPLNNAQDVAERFAAFEGQLSPESFSSP